MAGRARQSGQCLAPDTLLGWHRQGFRLFWRLKSRAKTRTPRVAADTIALIKDMALNNRLRGAHRIRGELLKLGIQLSKRTVQKYMRQARGRHRPSSSHQTWMTFLQNHAPGIWACDFLPVTTLFFSVVYVYFVVELPSRRVVHFGVTDARAAQQLRETTAFGQHPKRLICDNDGKFGADFARVANSTGIELLRTPYRAPKANAVCERLLGSVRRECLNHFFIVDERQLYQVVAEYVVYYNRSRPHRSLGQVTPDQFKGNAPPPSAEGVIECYPVLSGLHHEYRRVA